ncbi:serine hydrolase domain-containing protein [Propionibacteriaceae bacterium Y1685]|uniref:serine hydrolase domain-containing protein n=1 Tax=Microlunatus sp. Y1700 TaxID=3418487 RepID=UPI003B7BC5B8
MSDAQITPTTVPETGIDADAVRSVAAILPEWLESIRATRQLTGIQVAIWHRGELVTEVAVGPADAVQGIELQTTHRIRIASHSKMFCSLAVLALAERGDLRLDDQLGERVPELADAPVADVTIRDLLSHSAGLTRDDTDARWWQLDRPFPTRDELIEIARTRAVVTDPGLHLQYSNIGYGLLGLVIESVTGQPFDQAVRELVLDPVGTDGIGPDLPADAPGPEDPYGFAAGHSPLAHGDRRIVEQIPTNALAAATGFWATAGAIATFAGRVLCDGDLLADRWRREMRRRVWTVGESSHYALGLQQGELHGFAGIGHSGGFPTALTRTWAIPSERLVVSVLGTSVDAPSTDLANRILGLLALAGGRPSPGADSVEGEAALGGAGAGRPRPDALAEQPTIHLADRDLPAPALAEVLSGSYASLWGRVRLAVLGGRLFQVDETGTDQAGAAVELSITGVGTDPVDGSPVVELGTWGDSGYGSWAEPMRARIETVADDRLRCSGLWDTGQLLVPSDDFTLPDRITAP